MGIFAKALFERRDTTTLSDPAGWLYEAFGISPTDSGIGVSPRTSLKYTAVYACVNVLAQTIAQIPWDVYRKTGKTKSVAPDRSEHYLLRNEPNGTMSSFSFRVAFMANVLLYGNFYIEIIRDGAARTKALRLLPAWTVMCYEDFATDRLIYRVTRPNAQTELLDGSDVIHVPCLSLDGVAGLSPIAQNRQAVGLGLAAEAAGASFFGNGSRPSGYLSTAKPMRPEEREDLERKWFNKFGGSKNAGRVPVLSGDLKWNQLSIPPSDAQYIETRSFQAADIARVFRVPAVLIGLADKTSTYASADAFFLAFVKFAVAPWVQAIEQEFDRKLFPNTDELYCKFDLNGLLRADPKGRATFYKDLFATGSLSQNDIRDWEELDPIKGGDRYWIQQGFMPIDMSDEILAKQGAQPVLPAAQQDDQEDENAPDPEEPGSSRAVHVRWLEDVLGRVSKWEKRDAARVAEAMAPVFRSLRSDFLGLDAFCLSAAAGTETAAELIDRFLGVQ